ncbi:DUF3995 domain-containing protein [Bacillus sp. FJAT-49705]|uniref:DUF3995 domain-containing protein n=1 Tax=Cytobacillus citreus TaxID=2833586 RepID=A0ABS5NY81_9BACI|nr:DUF3995 domain-containing protein [Cytobacillus citreus]MBS4192797.1 DUF3995 domain-containing protein [Cytobacillus citreus]
MEINKRCLYLGATWTLLFAALSFYWAMGGMFGVRSLGGSIYEMALDPPQSFLAIVWMTGFIKLLGVVLLIMPLMKWRNSWIQKSLYFTIKICGLLLFLYGLFNFITISLNAIGILNFTLDRYSAFWRLVFWEPYWMLGGIFYFFSIKKLRNVELQDTVSSKQ